MNRIKTRETVKNIKALDKAAIASEHMRDTFIRSKDTALNLTDDGQVSPSEYANDKVQYVSADISREVTHKMATETKKAAQNGREAIQRRRAIKNREKNTVRSPADAQRQPSNPQNAKYAYSRPQVQSSDDERITNQARELARNQAKAKTVKQPAHSIKQTANTTEKFTANSAQRTVKTAEQALKMAVKTAQNTARTSQKASFTAERSAKLAVQSSRATSRAAVVTAKSSAKAISAAVKAIIAAANELAAAIAAGGWAAVVVIVLICLIGMIAASPFGIFFASDNKEPDAVPVSAAVAQVNYDFNEKLETIQSAKDYNDVVIDGAMADWPEILAVFAVKVASSEDADVTDVVTLDPPRIAKLKAVFWDMNSISSYVDTINPSDSSPINYVNHSSTGKILHITISHKTAADMASIYHFSDTQNSVLQELLAERDTLLKLIGEVTFISADAQEIIKNLPDDISPERKAVIKAACSLVGKVNYFWGGKSLTVGWDCRWGALQKVTADGSSTTGTYRPYGMDCSGFVDWVFYNASDGEYIISHGGGAAGQHSYCRTISWDEAMPGDLVFYPNDEHVGIVAGKEEHGNLLIINCASGYDNVVITSVDGFTSIGRPLFY